MPLVFKFVAEYTPETLLHALLDGVEMQDNPMGVMIYGYDEQTALKIKDNLDKLVKRDVMLITGSGRESERVAMIIGEAHAGPFEDKPNKVLMFLGFGDEHIGPAMKFFPKDIQRPIFCALTEQNVNWTLDYLIEHLLEEKARLSGQG